MYIGQQQSYLNVYGAGGQWNLSHRLWGLQLNVSFQIMNPMYPVSAFSSIERWTQLIDCAQDEDVFNFDDLSEDDRNLEDNDNV